MCRGGFGGLGLRVRSMARNWVRVRVGVSKTMVRVVVIQNCCWTRIIDQSFARPNIAASSRKNKPIHTRT